MSDKISIITPSFNSQSFINDCIESVLAQGEVIENHIIIDGGSTDGTQDIVKRYIEKHNQIILISEQDEGQADALNKGLKLVDTDYFGWLNADDRYIPNQLGQLVSSLNSLPQDSTSIIYGDYRLIDESSEVIGFRRQPSFSYFDCLYSYLTIHNGAAIFNTNLTKEYGGFNKSLKFAMDYDLILKLSRRNRVLHIKEFISDFRLHSSSKTTNLEKTRIEETVSLRKQYSQQNEFSIFLLNKISLLNVSLRMLREGVLFERIKRFLR